MAISDSDSGMPVRQTAIIGIVMAAAMKELIRQHVAVKNVKPRRGNPPPVLASDL